MKYYFCASVFYTKKDAARSLSNANPSLVELKTEFSHEVFLSCFFCNQCSLSQLCWSRPTTGNLQCLSTARAQLLSKVPSSVGCGEKCPYTRRLNGIRVRTGLCRVRHVLVSALMMKWFIAKSFNANPCKRHVDYFQKK